ncbi:MAG: DUF819 family protein [Bacteroidetes bacterium]|nr:DUF819 family protein [Bacteroidota bacterium]MDA0903761.1 DUF819 family protein [Bacteroidota bacterium]
MVSPLTNLLPLENDAVVLGLLATSLGLVFYTHSLPRFKTFYTFVPALLLCYFLPAAFNSMGLIDGEQSQLYFVASRYLLPASLILLCLSIDLKGIYNLGPKAIIMFFSATLGIIMGGPLALWLVGNFNPDVLGGDSPEAYWRGLSTVAGSWIGGGANQAALKEISETTDNQFSIMLIVDVFVANLWMPFLLFGAGMRQKIDQWLKADASAVDELQERVEKLQASQARIPSFTDLMVVLGLAFGGVALSHFVADAASASLSLSFDRHLTLHPNSPLLYLSSVTKQFFWLVVIATALGIGLSFTKAQSYEGAGASKIGSVFLYILVATIGMKMDIASLIQHWEAYGAAVTIGLVWMLVHIVVLLATAKIIRAPFFFVAVGSQANVGGAASAPIVASAFSPALAPVGVLLAVLGYAVGTVGAIVCMEWMHLVSMP